MSLSDTQIELKNESEVVGSSSIRGHDLRHDSDSDSRAPRAWLAEGWAYESAVRSASPKTSTAQNSDANDDDANLATPTRGPQWQTPGPPEALLITTRNWLAQMPDTLRPQDLIRLFPRIANNLSGLWDQPEICATYLHKLLTDTRDGKRRGFPKRVTVELGALLRLVETLTTQRDAQKRPGAMANGVDEPN